MASTENFIWAFLAGRTPLRCCRHAKLSILGELRLLSREWPIESSAQCCRSHPAGIEDCRTSVSGGLGEELVPWTKRSSYRAPRRSGPRGRAGDRTRAPFRAGRGGVGLDRRARLAISAPARGLVRAAGRSNRTVRWEQDRLAFPGPPLLLPKAGPPERAQKKCGPK